jgi:hypothetical protein
MIRLGMVGEMLIGEDGDGEQAVKKVRSKEKKEKSLRMCSFEHDSHLL